MKRFCLLVADAARARIYTYEQQPLELDGPHDELREVLDLVDEARLQRSSELFSDDSGSGRNGSHGYAFDDHRQTHVARLDSGFAASLIGHVARIAQDGGYGKLLIVASPRLMGALRAEYGTLRRTLAITELQRDFTKLTTSQLRDHLADLKLLPARPRLAFANR